jgi:exonuclease VII large subunit
MEDTLKDKTAKFSSRIDVLAGRLNSMNPLSVLNRGYSIVTERHTGKPLEGPAVQGGTKLRTYMAGGILDSVAEKGENMDFKGILLDFNSNKQ